MVPFFRISLTVTILITRGASFFRRYPPVYLFLQLYKGTYKLTKALTDGQDILNAASGPRISTFLLKLTNLQIEQAYFYFYLEIEQIGVFFKLTIPMYLESEPIYVSLHKLNPTYIFDCTRYCPCCLVAEPRVYRFMEHRLLLEFHSVFDLKKKIHFLILQFDYLCNVK